MSERQCVTSVSASPVVPEDGREKNSSGLPIVSSLWQSKASKGARYEVIRATMLDYSLYFLHGLRTGR